MTEECRPLRIFLSAAEPSGDLHCASLVESIRAIDPNVEFVGVGGDRMVAAGCEMLEITAHKAVMKEDSLKHLVRFYKLIKRISAYLKSNPVDLVIVCDSPAFNFHIAKAATKANIKTIYYVAPQLWAWFAWRIRKLRRSCTKLCCILPFEKQWFTERGVDTTFVGNPLVDGLGEELPKNQKNYQDFDPDRANIAIMPGSRPAEIKTLWKPMQQIALRLKEKYSNISFTTVAVDNNRMEKLKNSQIPGFDCQYSVSTVYKTARKCDFSIVTSGSATLQVAAAGCPMVIMYQSSRLLWHIAGKFMLTIKHLSLVNILAKKELVPEFMPYFTSIDPIVQAVDELLADSDALTRSSENLIDLTIPLCKGRAADNVAEIVNQMLVGERNEKENYNEKIMG